MQVLGSEDHKYWDITNARYTFIYTAIQGAPLDDLGKTKTGKAKKVNLADNLLRLILQVHIPNYKTMTTHLDLLTKLLDRRSRKEMQVLRSCNEISYGPNLERQVKLPAPALIVIADKISSEPWSADRAVSLVALKRLSSLIFG